MNMRLSLCLLRNNQKKCLLTFLFALWLTMPVSSQFDPQISQYMLHMPTFNPASVSENGMINASGTIRQQWLGMPGAPFTTIITVIAPLKMSEKSTNGLGIKFLIDNIGAFNNRAGYLQYAYKRKIGKNTLSLGADLGFVSVGFIADSVRADVNSEFHDFLGDTAIPTTDDTGSDFDMALGAFYSAQKYYLGVSYVHLNTPKISLNEEKTAFKVRGVLYATGGYDFSFREPKWKLRNSTLIKSDFTSWQAEISSRIEYNELFWGGLSYRFQDAAVVFFGAQLPAGMTLGVSFDVPASKMIKAQWVSFEAYLSYSFMFDSGKNSRYRSIRIL